MTARPLPASERGLLLLIAVALMASGVAFYAVPDRPASPLRNDPIMLENVLVVCPTFRDARAIHLNTATPEELVRLQGIGEVLAGRIVAYREEHGPFASLERLTDVSGIGPKLVEAIRGLVTLGEEETVGSPDQ